MPVLPESESNFYDRQPPEAPLAGGSATGGGARTLRTSRHAASRRRENNNRTPNRAMLMLVFRIVLIPILLLAGFLGLKAVVGLLNETTADQISQWEAEVGLMDNLPGTAADVAAEPVGNEDLNEKVLAERLTRWKTAERHVRAAEALEHRDIDGEAVSRLELALQFSPDNREATRLLAELYMSSGNYAKVPALCIRLLDQDSTKWDIKLLLLQALQAENKTEICVFLSSQMLLEQPQNMSVMEVAAYANAAQGNTDKAINIYKQILEMDPGSLLALEGSGLIYQWRKEWKKAIPCYLKLLDLDPKPEHYLALARSYAGQDEPSKTVVFLGQAASLYGSAAVSPWLSDPGFDPVRETVDFRSFADRIVGAEQRAKIEAIRRREIQKEIPAEAKHFKLPDSMDLQILNPVSR